jgi:hypothetical protein
LKKVNSRWQIYSDDDIFFGTHETSLDSIGIRSFYMSFDSPRSFIPASDSSIGEDHLIIKGEAETRKRSQCHADGTTSEDHLAELRVFVFFQSGIQLMKTGSGKV